MKKIQLPVMVPILIAAFTTLVNTSLALSSNTLDATKPLQKIAFGSCAMQFKPQPIWKAIANQSPDLFLFLGDNIYGDFDGKNAFTPTAETLDRDWQLLASQPHFSELRNKVPIMATWDNHDYGKHDGGAEFELKDLTKSKFLDFFGEPKNSKRRLTPGIYDAKIIGPAGKRVQIIILDTRYFKGPFIKDPRNKEEKAAAGIVGSMANYVPNEDPKVTLLGQQQWAWLEDQLKQPAEIRLIVSSTQVIADQKAMDEWGNYPLERQRLFDLIKNTAARGVILLSGNVHFSEISKTNIDSYELFDFTSSGMTHSNKAYAVANNPYRIAGAYDDLNFGMLEIDWDAKSSPEIKMTAMNNNGEVAFSYTVLLRQLNFTL
jgi:alkaline phosphatase D